METCVVGIASVEAKPINTKRGPSTVYNVSDDRGVEYTTFDRDIAAAAAARKGRSALLTFVTKQKPGTNRDGLSITYTNRYLESVEDTAEDIGPIVLESIGAAPESPVVAKAISGFLRETNAKDTSIARAVALKAAVEMMVAAGINQDTDANSIILLADAFLPYLLTGETPSLADIPF